MPLIHPLVSIIPQVRAKFNTSLGSVAQLKALAEAGVQVERVGGATAQETKSLLDALVSQGQHFRSLQPGEPAAPTQPTPPTEPEQPMGRFYTVQSGDTMGSIAKEFYGDGRKWPTIAAANKEILPDPNKLQVGMKLRIP